MKKHNLFKVVGITILVTVLLTWILPVTYYQYSLVSDGSRIQVGLFDLFNYPTVALSYFGNIVLYVLTIGGFYGVLHRIGAYRTLLDNISKKMKGKESIALAIIMIVLALLTSVCGASLGVLIIVPFIVSLVLLMGYDKITAALTTVGAISVGLIGTTLSSTYVANDYSSVVQNGMGIVNTILGTKATDQIIIKLILLVVGLALLIFNTLRYSKSVKSNKKSNESIEELIPTESKDKKAKTWPIVLFIDLMFIIAMLSLVSWTSVFNIDWFSKATEAVLGFEIFGFPIFGKIFGTIGAFEEWGVVQIGILLVIVSFVLSKIYKVKFNEYIDGIIAGAKKAIKPAVLITLIYVVLVIVSYHPIILTITKPLIKVGNGLNVFTMSLASLISSIFNVEMYYSASGVLPYAITVLTDTSVYSVIAVIWQGIYGIVTFFAPTSVILMTILSYLDIPYGKWLKSNWKLLLELIGSSLIVFTIALLTKDSLANVKISLEAVLIIFAIAIGIFSIVCMWKVFKKAGRNGWEAIIPIYNIVVLFQISGVNPLVILWNLVPIVGSVVFLVYSIMAYIKLAKSFNKSTGFGIGLILLNVIFMAILAFDSSVYKKISK